MQSIREKSENLMKRNTIVLLFWMTLLLFAPCWGQRRELHLLSANDMHATIEAFPQLAAIIDSVRQLDPSLLVFSAGDNRTGNPLNDKYEIPAYPMVALMNQLGFNASALGNHEFDVHSLPRLTELSNFRYLCCNMTASPETGIHTIPYQIFDAGGIRVGVIGTIQLNEQGIPSTHPDNLRGLSFQPASEVVGNYEWLSKTCDVTILLSHQGYEDDCLMAETFPWIDVILGGHSHKQLTGNDLRNGVLITHCKNKLPRVALVTLTLDSGKIVDKRSEYIDVRTFSKKNKLVEHMVHFFSNNPSFHRVLARASKPFTNREELGCMMCDAYRVGCNADIGIENPGGVRLDSLPAGDITMLDVLKMDPFDNHPVVLTLTGHQLLNMLLSYCRGRLSSFPYVSGMHCQLTASSEDPDQIQSVRLLTADGQPFDMQRGYRVATNSYVSATSDIPEGSAQMLNLLTTDLIMQFLEARQTVDYQGVRRLTLVEGNH